MRYWIAVFCLLLSNIGISFAQDAPTPYEIALERIAEAEVTDATELDLSYLGLTELPESMGDLSNLQSLYLENNQLSSLPESMGNLSNLQWLYLGGNQLSSLPESMGDLSNLHTLSLDNNQLSSLPDWMGDLSNLQVLYLYNNQLSSLPESMGDLSNLCFLYLQVNNFRHLPHTLGKLTHLADSDCILGFNGNPLISPPEEVIAEGTPAVLAYLRNQAWWHLQGLIIAVTSGLGLLALVILGVRWRGYRRMSNSKAKRQ